MNDTRRDYVAVVYNEQDRPFTQYPDQLARHLLQRYALASGQTLLDLGCGRGEFLRAFARCGLQVCGVDQSDAAKTLCPGADIRNANLEREPIPFGDDSFDVVYSKSVLEHFYYPENLVKEIYRVLKPGGLVISLVPDWEYNYLIYYEDYTHRTPFTLTSLRDIQLIHGFEQVEVERFRQLPRLWRMSWLIPFSALLAMLTPSFARHHSKTIRFSKEVMLLGSARKPAPRK
jgi:SAM-dependent methyltransferase